jgi:hypothetical protein
MRLIYCLFYSKDKGSQRVSTLYQTEIVHDVAKERSIEGRLNNEEEQVLFQ